MALLSPVPHRFVPGPYGYYSMRCNSCKAWTVEESFRSRHLPRITWLDVLPLAPVIVLAILYLLNL